jgi:hypothetical protein
MGRLLALIAAFTLALAGCGGSGHGIPVGPVDVAPTTGTLPAPVPAPGPTPSPSPEPAPDADVFRAQANAICTDALMQGFALRTDAGAAPAAQVIDLFWNDQERQLPYWQEALDRMAAVPAPPELSAAWSDYIAAGRDLAALIAAGLGQVRSGADPVAVFGAILPEVIAQVRRAQARAMEAELVECFKLYYGGRLSGGETTAPDGDPEPPPDEG